MIFKLKMSSRKSRGESCLRNLHAILKNSAARYICINPPILKKSSLMAKQSLERRIFERWHERGVCPWCFFGRRRTREMGEQFLDFIPSHVTPYINNKKNAWCGVQFDETSSRIHGVFCDEHELIVNTLRVHLTASIVKSICQLLYNII